jgi:mycobactin peptide synthetase MbtE
VSAVVERGPVRAYTSGATLDEAFRRHVDRAPSAIAVMDGDRTLSYAELDAAADGYAMRLAELGVGPGARVPLACPRSAEFVAAALAVMRLGAAYAGIDRLWPRSRIADVIRRLRPPLVVAGSETDLLAAAPDVPVWVPGPLMVTAPANPPAAPEPDGDRVCCVYFTSGSTGEPKAVLARHRGLLRLFEPPGFARFGPGVVMPLAASPAWDGLSMELWSMLTTGGTVVVIRETYLDAATLRRVIAENGVTTVMLTTSLFVMIVDEDLGALSGLSEVYSAGETLPPAAARRFLEAHPDIRLLDIYGPAEVGYATTTRTVTLADCDRPDGVPLSDPVANTELYIVNEEVPELDGREGELCIGGDGLAEGYLDDPDRTAARFPDLPTGNGIRRVHRSGDLVRVGPDGLMSLLGRADRQVKVAGFRVDPSETEQAMRALPGVRSAAVVPRPAPGGGYRDLVACYTAGPAEGEPAVERDEVRRLLGSLRIALPSYLVPVAVRRVERIPLLPNGKLDGQRVVELTGTVADPREAVGPGAAQASGTELAVVGETFAAVLGLADVPPDASAFDLGATSLDAGRICARLGRRLGTSVPVSVFMAEPTVAAVAEWLTRSVPDAVSTGAAGTVPLTAAQTAFWFSHLLEPDDRTIYCVTVFDIDGPLRPEVLVRALADVQDRHQALRTRYGHAGEPTAAPEPSRPVPFVECADRAAVLPLLTQPFDLAAGEVWRAVLAARPDGATFGVAVHHIAFDGWSEAVFARDLTTAYAARLTGAAPRFTAPAPSLAELWAAYRRRQASVDLDAQRAFWSRCLAGLPPLQLPADGDDDGAGVVDAGTVPADVLAQEARRHGATPFAVLATAYAGAVADVIGQRDFGLGTAVAQRATPGAADAVGCLLTTLCLRLPVVVGGDLRAALTAAHPALSAAFAAQDVPFDEVVRLTAPQRSARNPLFDVMLVLQDTPPAELVLPGCTVTADRPVLGATIGLVAEVRARGDGELGIQLIHDRRRVGTGTAKAVATAFTGLLGQLTGDGR